MPIPTRLHLSVADYKDANHWYWRLTDSSGQFLADQEVNLNPHDFEYAGFVDLPAHLAAHSSQDHRREDEARFVDAVGKWMGRNFYGPIGDKILASGTPTVVHVEIPLQPIEAASGLLYRPWELGYVQGKPLAVQDVSLIFEVTGESDPIKHVEVGETLRILAVFSLPEDKGVGALNLRQERYELSRTIRQKNGAIDLRVLQYGVTREALRRILEEGDGWDIVHFSGHGLESHLILEKADGTLDLVPSDELVELLRPARGRLKWVTLSACLSAAATVEETLRWLGVEPKRSAVPEGQPKELQAVARALVKSLDCAVLAMRYSVGDQFAIDLGRGLFEGVLAQRQSLARALQVVLPELAQSGREEAVAVATPTLFGRYAADLAIEVPDGEPQLRLGLSYFPPEPERFVGRVGLLTRSRTALSLESNHTGVLFHGMSGGGKTACALELAYQYQDIDRFKYFVWFQAPPDGHDISTALVNFGSKWDIQLNQPAVPLLVITGADEATFTNNLPRVTSFLSQRSVLIVIDNIESLLRSDGTWRDPRWEKLIAVLMDHRGQSRLVLTSRVRPQGLSSRVLALPLHSLSLNEAALLARQSTHLGALLRDPKHRPLVIRTLRLVQGHPKLLELAEAQAGSAERLSAHLDRAQEAATAGAAQLEAFFKTGDSTLTAEEHLRTLYAWTKSVAASLPEYARTLFFRLCCLEEEDREESVVKAVWGDLTSTLKSLVEAGLLSAAYHIHPSVAEAGREKAGRELRNATNLDLSSFWIRTFDDAQENERAGLGGLLLRAGRSAAPYLIRQRRWSEAQGLLERVLNRDDSRATVAEILPLIRKNAEFAEGNGQRIASAAILGKALAAAGRTVEAEEILRRVEIQAGEEGLYRVASGAALALTNLLREGGHFEEALNVVGRRKHYTGLAGLGRWTQLSGEALQLQVQIQIGHYEDALVTIENLRREMKSLPKSRAEDESVNPWSVEEVILGAGCIAAARLQGWQESLSFSKEVVQLMVSVGATPLEVARRRYNDYGSLIALQRYDEARSLLHHCRTVFESADSIRELGLLYSALAHLEDNLQHFPESLRQEGNALRYKYAAGQPEDCAVSHFNLATCPAETNAKWRIAHYVASALIFYQTAHGQMGRVANSLRRYLAELGPRALPSNFDELCELVDQTEGVHFRDLFSRLPQRAASGDEALQKVLEMARAPEGESEIPEFLRPLFEAAASSQDVEPMLAALKEQLAENPQADEMIAQLRAALAEVQSKAQNLDTGDQP